MRRDKYRQSDEKKFNTLYGSNFSRDTRELTPEQRRYLEIVEEERKYGSRRRENDRRAIRREKRKKRFAGMNKPVKPGSKKKKIAVIILTLIILIMDLPGSIMTFSRVRLHSSSVSSHFFIRASL